MYNDITIAIPSKGRADKQITLACLPDNLKDCCSILVDAEEFDDYALTVDGVNVIGLPEDVKGIGKVRQWAVENCPTPYLFLLDDDMVFFRRIPGTVKLEKCDPYNVDSMFRELYDWMSLDDVPVVGVSARQGNNHNPNDYQEATRQMNFHGIDVERFKALGLQFDGQEVMEDFYMTLSLLTQGIPNRVMYQYCWNQVGSGAEGGCSSYRTWEVQKRCAHELAESFPDFVTVVEKTTKTTWKEFPTRFDVRVQWKKAYQYGIKQNDLL